MSDASVPRRIDPKHGEHVEQDRPVTDEPADDSDPDREPNSSPNEDPGLPGPPPAHPLRPG